MKADLISPQKRCAKGSKSPIKNNCKTPIKSIFTLQEVSNTPQLIHLSPSVEVDFKTPGKAKHHKSPNCKKQSRPSDPLSKRIKLAVPAE